MLRRIIDAGTALAVVVTSGIAFGHPGHGVTPPDEPVHVLEPIHLAPVVLVGLGVAVYAWRRARRES